MTSPGDNRPDFVGLSPGDAEAAVFRVIGIIVVVLIILSVLGVVVIH